MEGYPIMEEWPMMEGYPTMEEWPIYDGRAL